MVDQPFDRDRLRPWLRDSADADRDAGGTDGDRARASKTPALVGGIAAVEADVRPPRGRSRDRGVNSWRAALSERVMPGHSPSKTGVNAQVTPGIHHRLLAATARRG